LTGGGIKMHIAAPSSQCLKQELLKTKKNRKKNAKIVIENKTLFLA